MARYLSGLMTATLLGVATPGGAAQYEATLLTQRSIRHQTSFGLFEDDFDAFVRPRYLYRWDGARLSTHLADIAPAGEASFGYGRAVTDGWSWSLLGAGGYARHEAFRGRQRLFTSGTGDQMTRNFATTSAAVGVPTERNSAQAAFGVSRELGPGMLGLGLQAQWRSDTSRSIDNPAALFTLPSPDGADGAGNASAADLDTGALFEASNFERNPQTERRSLAAALLAGYAVRKDKGWGYSLDILAGAVQHRENREFEALEESRSATGSATQRYKTSSLTNGVAPAAGAALTFLRAGRRPLWVDLGGEYSPGYAATGEYGRTTGLRNVSIDTGGLKRQYSLREERVDTVDGTLEARQSLTLGIRQSMALDPLLQLGWGLHARYAAVRDERTLAATYGVTEILNEKGTDRPSDATHAQAEGQSSETQSLAGRSVEITAPIALMIRSATDAALEWRLGGEVRYRNETVDIENTVGSVAVPSGRRVSSTAATSVVRYAGFDVPAGSALHTRDITVQTALRAGVGYWFSPTAKLDAVIAGEPSGDGFIGFDRHSFGLAALLAF